MKSTTKMSRCGGSLPEFSIDRATSTRLHRAIGLGAALLALAWALPAAAAKGGAWLQIGYNSGHSGYNKTERVISSKNVTKLANTATYTTGGAVLTPVISKGIVYVRSSDQNIYAWNLATGKLVWSIPLANLDGPNGMAIGGDRLVTNCGLGNNTSGICAFDAKTGKSLWSYGLQSGNSFTPPAIAGNTVYLGQSGLVNGYNVGWMVAVNLKTGVQRWLFGSCTNGCEAFGSNAPAVDNGMVYFGCIGQSGDPVTVTGVCAANASSGALVWQYQLGLVGHGDDQGRLIAQGGTVYAAYMTANCYQCGYTIDVTALNGSTGTEMWDTPLTGQLNQSYYPLGTPVLGPDGTVYEGISTSNNPNQPNMFALNADGTFQWQVSTVPSFESSPPTLVGKPGKGVLFLPCSGGNGSGGTCAFDASDGSFVWQSSDSGLASYDYFAPVVTGGAVYNDCNGNDLCVWTPQ